MTPLVLARKLAVMEEFPPLAASLDYGCQPGPTGVWYDSQRMHWLGYLQTRQDRGDRNAAACYRRIQNVSMLIWLADVAKVSEDLIVLAATEALRIPDERKRGAHQSACIAFRRHIPWDVIATAL